MTRTSMTVALGLPSSLMLALLMTTAPAAAQSASTQTDALPADRTVLPIPEPQYPHSTVFDVRNATPPPRFEVKAPAKAPNVLIVLIDDMGFGQSSAFGGPIHMPTVDQLANEGLRYNEFHTTALCSPTRAALLSGRNHHMNNMGSITETATAFPGQTGQRPNSVTPLAEMLRLNGYSTAAFGKSHETAAWEVSPSGPTDRWPTRSGFDKFYGFIGGETNQWAPLIYDGMTQVEPPHDPKYNFMTDMTDKAIGWMQYQKSLTPDWIFIRHLGRPMWDTISIATLGTIISILMAVPVAYCAARNTTPSATLVRPVALFIIVASRSINSLIWALMLVTIVGPGVFAGIIAIGLRSIGFCAKLLYEAIEEIDEAQVEAVRATGASGAQVSLFGIMPQVMPAFAGISVFRWDINIRESTVLGLVGAGGIGLELNAAITQLYWTQVSLILLLIIGTVIFSEWVSAQVRHAII